MQRFYSSVQGSRGELINMKHSRKKIFLDEARSFFGRGEGCLIARDKERKVENAENSFASGKAEPIQLKTWRKTQVASCFGLRLAGS
jgi:hypothetical protein